MASVSEFSREERFRKDLGERGGASVARCFQCGTCSSVCELAPEGAPFPRRQMVWAQWGMAGRLTGDPALWLCHQCNDCSMRCPRDARPGDVLQALRSQAIEDLAVPGFMGTLVAKAAYTWPLLLGAPLLFWMVVLFATGHLRVPSEPVVYGDVVPHGLIYAVFFPLTALVATAAVVSARRFWALLGSPGERKGSFLASLTTVLWEVATHRRFDTCGAAKPRRVGHLWLLWGFVGAAVTSGLIIVAMYGMGADLPLPQAHPFKILGNLSAAMLLVGGTMLVVRRLASAKETGTPTAFDTFFLAVVMLVVISGIGVELARYAFTPERALALYLGHLSVVTCLFLTFPYSKFAHLLYRTLALVHERMSKAGDVSG